MAAPVSNDLTPKLDARQGRGAERSKADEVPLKGEPEREASAPQSGDDTVSLSQAGRLMSNEPPEKGRGPNTPEEAQKLVARFQEKLAANPGFANALHNASEVSRLATTLDNYA